MKKIATFAALCAAVLFTSCANHNAEGYNAKAVWPDAELEQLKEDVRKLTNDIDNAGDIDKYGGSDHFERLYDYSHNL